MFNINQKIDKICINIESNSKEGKYIAGDSKEKRLENFSKILNAMRLDLVDENNWLQPRNAFDKNYQEFIKNGYLANNLEDVDEKRGKLHLRKHIVELHVLVRLLIDREENYEVIQNSAYISMKQFVEDCNINKDKKINSEYREKTHEREGSKGEIEIGVIIEIKKGKYSNFFVDSKEPRYQRIPPWKYQRASEWLSSLIKDPNGGAERNIILAKQYNESTFNRTDGNSRFNVIEWFLDNKFFITIEGKEYKYEDLIKEKYLFKKFKKCKLPYVKYEDLYEDEQIQLFHQVNQNIQIDEEEAISYENPDYREVIAPLGLKIDEKLNLFKIKKENSGRGEDSNGILLLHKLLCITNSVIHNQSNLNINSKSSLSKLQKTAYELNILLSNNVYGDCESLIDNKNTILNVSDKINKTIKIYKTTAVLSAKEKRGILFNLLSAFIIKEKTLDVPQKIYDTIIPWYKNEVYQRKDSHDNVKRTGTSGNEIIGATQAITTDIPMILAKIDAIFSTNVESVPDVFGTYSFLFFNKGRWLVKYGASNKSKDKNYRKCQKRCKCHERDYVSEKHYMCYIINSCKEEDAFDYETKFKNKHSRSNVEYDGKKEVYKLENNMYEEIMESNRNAMFNMYFDSLITQSYSKTKEIYFKYRKIYDVKL